MVAALIQGIAKANYPAVLSSPEIVAIIARLALPSVQPELQLLAMRVICAVAKHAVDWEDAALAGSGILGAVWETLTHTDAHPDVIGVALYASVLLCERRWTMWQHLGRGAGIHSCLCVPWFAGTNVASRFCRHPAFAVTTSLLGSPIPSVAHNVGLLLNRLAFVAACAEGPAAKEFVPHLVPVVSDLLRVIRHDVSGVVSGQVRTPMCCAVATVVKVCVCVCARVGVCVQAQTSAVLGSTVNISMALFNLSAMPQLRVALPKVPKVIEQLLDIVSVSSDVVQSTCLKALVNFTVDCDQSGYAVFVSRTGLSCMLGLLSRRPPLTHLFEPLTELYASAVQQDGVAVAFASHDGLAELQLLVDSSPGPRALRNMAIIFAKLSENHLAPEVVDKMVELASFKVLLTLCQCGVDSAEDSAMRALDGFATFAARPVDGVAVGEHMTTAGAVTVCVTCVKSAASLGRKVFAMQALAKLAQASSTARAELMADGRCKALLLLAQCEDAVLRLSVAYMLQVCVLVYVCTHAALAAPFSQRCVAPAPGA